MLRVFLRGRTLSVPMAAACAWMGLATAVFAQADATDQSVIPFNEIANKELGITADIVSPGDSSRKQRQDAIGEIPTKHLNSAAHQKVKEVISSLSLFRRLPTVTVTTDKRVYNYFLQHPDVAVSVWRAMEISQVQLTQTGPTTYSTDTKDGTSGTVEVLYRGEKNCLILCHGQLQGPGMPKPIQARALMHLQPVTVTDTQVTHRCDLFVSFPSYAVEAIAKLVSPMSFRVADRNFEEISLFVSLMSNAMVTQPGWVEQISMNLDGVPAERIVEIRDVTAAVYVDAERRKLTKLGRPVSLEAILPPVAEVTPTSASEPVLR